MFGNIKEFFGSEALLPLLKKSGCFGIFYGVESGSQEVLNKGMGKKVHVDEIRKVLIETKKSKIFTVTSIIFPGPFETEQTKSQTQSLLLETQPDSVCVQFPGIFPGTQWANNPEKYNLTLLNPKNYVNDVMTYKLKLLYPPSFWPPLPFKVNGKPYKIFSKETESFVQWLEINRILTDVTDDIALMAQCAELNPREFRDTCRQYLYVGNAERIGKLVELINYNILNNLTSYEKI